MAIDRLAGVGLFADLDRGLLEEMATSLRRRRYARGQVIFGQGDPGTSLCIVESGRVNITVSSPDGKELILNVMGPGDFFGELALLDDEPRSADAIAAEPTELLLLHRDDLWRFVEARPVVAMRMLAVVSRKLRQTTQQAQDVAFLDVPARLARRLLALCGQNGDADAPCTIPRRLTQTELAGMIGATRESVNKWLGFYERQGLIRAERGRITVLQPRTLRRRAY